MERPKEAIERVSSWWAGNTDTDNVLAYLDWLEGKHVCEWPSELTRERLLDLALEMNLQASPRHEIALKTLAAIAPQKKRVVNLYRDVNGFLHEREKREPESSWRKVAGPIEIED